MVKKPYCKENYQRCICATCKYDKDNCCGRDPHMSRLCPLQKCPTYVENRKPRFKNKEEPNER